MQAFREKVMFAENMRKHTDRHDNSPCWSLLTKLGRSQS